MTQSPTENQSASLLSAGVDGELGREELRFLLRRLDHDVVLRDSWSRYHVAREGLRRQLSPLASADFAARVMQAIEHDAAAHGGVAAAHRVRSGRTRGRPWLRWSAGGAIAAGVAVAALTLVQPSGDDNRGRVAAEPAALAGHAVASVAAKPQPTSPAAVPPWLSSQTASRYSQQAAATLGESYNDVVLPYTHNLAPYHVQAVRAADRPGGYLLLIDPQTATQAGSRAAPVAQ